MSATPASSVSDHDSVAAESRWSELYRLLLAPGTTAWALAPTTTPNRPVKERAGDAVELIGEAEQAGAGRAVWAVVAPVRTDLLVIDLDRCASQVWPQLQDVAGEHSAEVAYLAASGSPDSIHAALSCATTAGEHAITDFLGRLRAQLGLPASRVAVQPRGHLLRLPGSASLKPGGRHCVPVDDDLRPITAVAAVQRLESVLNDRSAPVQGEFTRRDSRWCVRVPAASYRAGLEVEVRRRDGLIKVVELGEVAYTAGDRIIAEFVDAGDTPSNTASATSGLAPAPQLRLVGDDSDDALQWQSPRAWRPRQSLSAADWQILNDSTTSDRSAAATAAAWVLWRAGVGPFAAARWYYQHLPAFAKFRNRDRDSRGGGTSARSACVAHWEAIAERARTYRPPISPTDQDMLNDAFSAVATWDDPALVAAGVAVLTHRFGDGHGLRDRPIAQRDLAAWMFVCDSRAHTYLKALVELGLLICARDWADGPPWQATLWHLGATATIYRGHGTHDVTHLRGPTSTPLQPLWGQLGFVAHAVWSCTLRSPTTLGLQSRDIADKCGLKVGDHSHGVLRVLRELAGLGLVTRVGLGRGTRWIGVNGPGVVAAAAEQVGAVERAQQLLARIVAERKVWHAEGPGERSRMATRLVELRKRLTHSDIAGRAQGSLFGVSEQSPAVKGPPSSGRSRWIDRIRR